MKATKPTNRVAAHLNGTATETPLTLTFERERETKNCIRFAEVGTEPIVGTLYINKSAAADWQSVRVTITGS